MNSSNVNGPDRLSRSDIVEYNSRLSAEHKVEHDIWQPLDPQWCERLQAERETLRIMREEYRAAGRKVDWALVVQGVKVDDLERWQGDGWLQPDDDGDEPKRFAMA